MGEVEEGEEVEEAAAPLDCELLDKLSKYEDFKAVDVEDWETNSKAFGANAEQDSTDNNKISSEAHGTKRSGKTRNAMVLAIQYDFIWHEWTEEWTHRLFSVGSWHHVTDHVQNYSANVEG